MFESNVHCKVPPKAVGSYQRELRNRHQGLFTISSLPVRWRRSCSLKLHLRLTFHPSLHVRLKKDAVCPRSARLVSVERHVHESCSRRDQHLCGQLKSCPPLNSLYDVQVQVSRSETL